MKSAIALIFFACIAGSMANNIGNELLTTLAGHGQQFLNQIVTSLQQNVAALAAQLLGQATQLIGTIGGRFDFSSLLGDLTNVLQGLGQQLLTQATGALLGALTGSRGFMDQVSGMFAEFASSVQTAVMGMGQHLLNQGLSAVLGGLAGSSRGIFDSFTQSLSGMVDQASSVFSGVLAGLSQAGALVLATAQPHWEDLQQQLLGHGMNVLGSVSETINNMHGSLVGGR
ncbi:unnamed protein product [Adineta steineri]|uniref:Uncharacterized protein n=2 Tax=Adineta steineri TaxID=433720 RepID=A0A814XTE2_9BILA|nr:unnamed protein product [Adineta steineri]